MKRSISILLVSVLTCVYSVPAFGWGQKGHRIVAKIAYDNLSCKAKKKKSTKNKQKNNAQYIIPP